MLLPADKVNFKDNKYLDPETGKPIKFPDAILIRNELKKSRDKRSVTIDYVTPHSPVGMSAIIEYGGNKFYIASTQGINKTMSQTYKDMYRIEGGYEGRTYVDKKDKYKEGLAEQNYIFAHLDKYPL